MPPIPALDSTAQDHPGLSLAWRCRDCARYHLFKDMTPQPAACTSCGSAELRDAGPLVEPEDDGSEP